jgi:NADH:ubiquinone oxidoreductase subunit 3 (subunit A)
LELNQTTKIVGGGVLTVVLGAIGSGVWERLLSPAWAWLVRQALTVLTLGIDSASDSIYQTVAFGHTESFSVLTYIFITISMLAVPIIGLALFKISPFRNRLRRKRKLDAMFDAGNHAGIEAAKTKDMRLFIRLRKTTLFFLWVLLLDSAYIAARTVSMSYSNMAISHFNQSLTIVSPYLSENEEKMIKSKFAGIRNKSDYDSVMQSIQNKASEHGRSLVKFTVW